MLLTEDPGPSNTLAGVVPSDLADREPASHWLVYGPTFVWACHAATPDVAMALVLWRLGYTDRPWLADNLNARPAAAHEIAAVCSRRKVEPLFMGSKIRPLILAVARSVHRAERHRAEELDPT